MTPGITVAIPAHLARVRNGMINRAVNSVYAQEMPATSISVALDKDGDGAAVTRQRALDMVVTEWTAFLDSDDEFLPQHLKRLFDCAWLKGADYTYSYFVRAQGGDPLGHFGKVFNPATPHHTTMTILVKTELAKEAGMVNFEHALENVWSGEDWRFTLRCVELGAKIIHVPEETWVWHRHGGNTSGVPGKGDA